MKYRPYNSKQWEIPLLLSGQRTQFRKVIKGRPPDIFRFCSVKGGFIEFRHFKDDGKFQPRDCIPSPYRVGQRLRVKEVFRDWMPGGCEPMIELIEYKANEWSADKQPKCLGIPPSWKPAIAMPPWASRLTLEITDIRVQRLQEISEEDAIAEGVDMPLCAESEGGIFETRRRIREIAFPALWNRMNGKRSWNDNPWVLAVTHKRAEV